MAPTNTDCQPPPDNSLSLLSFGTLSGRLPLHLLQWAPTFVRPSLSVTPKNSFLGNVTRCSRNENDLYSFTSR